MNREFKRIMDGKQPTDWRQPFRGEVLDDITRRRYFLYLKQKSIKPVVRLLGFEYTNKREAIEKARFLLATNKFKNVEYLCVASNFNGIVWEGI